MNLLPQKMTRLFGLTIFTYSATLLANDVTITIEDKKQRATHGTVIELIGQNPNITINGSIEVVQIDKEFTPEMSVFPRGSSVLFSNRDPFQHHVYSVSKGNQFDLPLYKGTPISQITFESPGIVKLGCNIHDWMLAFAYVSQSEHLIVSDASGKVRFTGIPEGEYELRVWNPRLKNNKKVISQSITILADQSLEQTVKVSLRKKIRKPLRHENDNYDG